MKTEDMKILDPFQMNDWPIKKFLIIILTFHLLFWGSIGLDLIGLNIPLLRQLVCFIYLSFVPGILILRVIRFHKLGCIETLLYSVGLSLPFLMFIGFFMNIFYPLVCIKGPISIIPLVLTISFVILLLCFLCYLIDRNYSDPNYIHLNDVFSKFSLFFYLIPIWTVVGTYLMNYYSNNFILMIVIFLISLIILLVCFDITPVRFYPLAIFIASFSLLFHASLISMYISGWDIQVEYYLANKVLSNSLWDSNIIYNANSTLSIVMLAPIYSILLNLELTWIFKIIYPAIFSLISLGLYLIFKKQTDNKIAFMATFFFISLYVFYTEMLGLARQQIAEYIFILILLLIVKNNYDVVNRILLLIFSFSLVVSHYGLSYLFIGAILFSSIILYPFQKYLCGNLKSNLNNFSFGVVFFVFFVAWYLYTSNSAVVQTIVDIFKNVVETFFSEFLNPDRSQGMSAILRNSDNQLHRLGKIIHIFTQIAISFGLLQTLVNFISLKKSEFNTEYLSLSIFYYFLLVFSILIPNFDNALNASRIYQVSLIYLAPFCIIGFITSFKTLFKILKLNIIQSNNKILKILCIFFAFFLLFNTGWIYELVDGSSTSFSLNSKSDYPKFNEEDVTGKEWLYKATAPVYKNIFIYADYYRYLIFQNCFDRNQVGTFPIDPQWMLDDSYIYLSSYNTIRNKVLIYYPKGVNNILQYVEDKYSIKKNQIYNNGGAKIYI